MPFLSGSLSKVFSCIKIELVFCVSSSLKVLFYQSILSATSVTILSSSISFGTNFDWFSFHSAHWSSINLVSVYDSLFPILCKSVITSRFNLFFCIHLVIITLARETVSHLVLKFQYLYLS